MKSPTELLLIKIDEFLERTGMGQATFGADSVGDPNLVTDLRCGRELRHRTLLRVEAFMNRPAFRLKRQSA